VRPDGTVGLGIYGSAFVGGLTIEQAREAIAEQLRRRVPKFDIRDLNVDVLAYNSKFYYVITDGGGYGEQVYPFPITGSETVLDALGRINGLPPASDKRRVWVARRGPGYAGEVMPVDWCGIVQRGATATNYQLMPGDRIYVKADRWISADSWIGKRLSPIERILGATLLGSETVNSIRNSRSGGTSSP
jgi:polysaccharide export outer membrane protein